MSFYDTREDGPNKTAANKTVAYNNTNSNMAMHSQDEVVDGVPSRVITNMQLNVGELDVPKVPEYTKEGIKAELADMERTGRQQMVVPVTDPVQSTAYKQLSREVGADYVEADGVGKFKPGAKTPMSSTTASFNVATALTAGHSEEDVKAFLANQGYDDAETGRLFTQSTQIVQARKAGYTDEEITEFLGADKVTVQNVDTVIPEYQEKEPTKWIVTQWGAVPQKSEFEKITSNQSMSVEDLVTSLKVLNPNMSSMTTRVSGFFGNQEAAAKAAFTADASRKRIIAKAAENNVNLTWHQDTGNFLVETPAGFVPVDEGIWSSLIAEKGEITGALAGAIAGVKTGSRFGPWGAFGGSIVGAASGSAIGSQFDYLYQAIKLQEDLDAKVMAHKALTAAEMSVAGDVVGFGLFKGSGAVWKGMTRVKDLVVDGNSKGAYNALKEMEFMSDSEAKDLVTQLARVSDAPITGSDIEQAITATALTKPGTEQLVKAVASFDPQASRAVIKAIDARAKDVLKSTAELSNDNLGRIIQEDLANYVADTKNFYGQVKAVASQSPRSSNFTFDYNKLAVQPVIDTLQKNITDPTVLEKFKLQSERIRGMTDSRTFGDLLELRQIVNEFRFNTRITKTKDYETLNQVIKNIDGAITQGAGVVLENPKKWLGDYADARKGYAQMKQLEKNVMFKALTRPGINEKQVVQSVSKYITALDGTFNDLVTKLPPKLKGDVENAVIDTLANKFTAGVGEGSRAVNFPLLSNELNKVNFSTPDARRMKSALNELAEVFKNDVPLSQATGNIQIPQFQSYLTADPVVRAKFELASGMFNYVKTLVPNKQQNSLALIRKTAKVLENPLNSKSVKELMEESGDKVDLSTNIIKMQQEAARAAANGRDAASPKVKLYGNGSVLSTSSSAGAETTIPLHRIATTQDARTIAEAQGIDFADTKLLDGILAQHGYRGVQQGTDRVRLLKGQ